MENETSPIAHEVLETIRVSLHLNIREGWKMRRLPFSRQQLKKNVQALRVMRDAQTLHYEKFFWVK